MVNGFMNRMPVCLIAWRSFGDENGFCVCLGHVGARLEGSGRIPGAVRAWFGMSCTRLDPYYPYPEVCKRPKQGKQANKHASTQASKHVSTQASKRASKRTSKQEKQANKCLALQAQEASTASKHNEQVQQASKRASKQASKQSKQSKQASRASRKASSASEHSKQAS